MIKMIRTNEPMRKRVRRGKAEKENCQLLLVDLAGMQGRKDPAASAAGDRGGILPGLGRLFAPLALPLEMGTGGSHRLPAFLGRPRHPLFPPVRGANPRHQKGFANPEKPKS